jgi:hypothetical protein
MEDVRADHRNPFGASMYAWIVACDTFPALALYRWRVGYPLRLPDP